MQIRLSLGLKLGALVAVILATFSASWWLVHHEFAAIERLYSRVVTVHDPALDAAYKMHLSHVAIGMTVRDALAGLGRDAPHRLDDARQDFAGNLHAMQQLAGDDNRGQLRELASLHASYLEHAERIVTLGQRRDADLQRVASLLTAFKRVLLDAVLPTTGQSTLDQAAAEDLRRAIDRLDETARQFLLAPDGRQAWRVDEALKYFQRDLSARLAPSALLSAASRADTVRRSADDIDRAVYAAIQSDRALATSMPAFDALARMIDYRLSTRFEPGVRRDMRQATAAALTRIRDADHRAAWLLAAAGLVGTLVYVVIIRNVLRPVRRLLDATHAIGGGEYRHGLEAAGNDEIAALARAFNDMARRLEQTTISRALFDDILRALDEALFVTSERGDIELANRAAHELTGCADGALAGRPIAAVLRATDDGTALSERRSEHWLRTADGELAVLAARSPLDHRHGAPRRLVVTALDITRRREAELALAASRDELQALHASQAQRLEAERAVLARELHDELGASLTTMKTVVFLADSGRRDVGLALRELGAGIDSMSEATSRIVNGLRPPVLDHFGLVAALDWYVRDFSAHTGLHCVAELPAEDLEMPPVTALALFRAAQECLTNASRHARASKVHLRLRANPDRLVLEIVDDGIGCAADSLAASPRFGLRGLRERLRAIGGSLDIETRPGRGLRASISAPFVPAAQAA